MAKDWGVPPWQIETDGNVLWHLRWITYQNEIARGQRTRERHG